MRDVLAELERLRARRERIALATVVATRRSAPRPVGSKLVVSEGGELHGSVSGGCVESEVYEACREVLGGAPPRLITFGISDEQALSVGLPCGGEIDVFVNEPEAAFLDAVAAVVRGEERAVAFTELDSGDQRLAREHEDESADALLRDGSSRVVELDGRSVFAEVFGPPPQLLVFGAVDTGEALCRLAKGIGWRTIVSDARARFATRERVPSADEVIVAWPEETLDRVRPDHATAIVVLTHDEKFDVPALIGALATDAFYVGALGSRRAQAKRRERLLDAGVSEEALERLHGPAGLDIGAHTPAETAVSMLAEILAVRAGREGGPLRESARRIHAQV
jgi:xanthine dehydrogenase accessory factor